MSPLRGLDLEHFDFLVGVLFNRDFTVGRACRIPHSVVLQKAAHRAHVNGWILHLQESVWDLEDVEDITDMLKAMETEILATVAAAAGMEDHPAPANEGGSHFTR